MNLQFGLHATSITLWRRWQSPKGYGRRCNFGFEPFRSKIIYSKAVDLLWSRVVVVPLVRGKSLAGQALPHFRGAFGLEDVSLEDQIWRVVPHDIPADVWSKLGLSRWPVDSRLLFFVEFLTNYGALLQHVDHMADLRRMPDEIDDQGAVLLQNYLHREIERAQPIFQATLDSCARLLGFVNEIASEEKLKRPNLLPCLALIVDSQKALLPTPDFSESLTLRLDQIVNWRDRLRDGLGPLGIANLLWTADVFGFGECKKMIL